MIFDFTRYSLKKPKKTKKTIKTHLFKLFVILLDFCKARKQKNVKTQLKLIFSKYF
jgi:protein involved in temperature-dependent protein secretion